MAVPLIDIPLQHKPLRQQILAALDEIVTSGQFILGPRVERFEQALARYCGTPRALGLSSGTDAILIALMALGIKPGDEVVTTPFTFFATAGCVARLGAVPVFVDIDPATFNIDPALIERAITPRTRAIIPVHLYGQMAEMRPIMALARKHGLKVVEDAAQAIGAHDGAGLAGGVGDVGCLSFYPTKNLSAIGDAGACVTHDSGLADRMAILRQHGMERQYYYGVIGGNFRLDAVQAAVLDIKLPLLDGWCDARRRHAQRYRELLAGLPLTLPLEAPGKRHVYHQFTIRASAAQRNALQRHLAAHGIGQAVYYPLPLHLQKCFDYLGHQAGAFPHAEAASREVLSLPVFPEMTQDQQDQVAAAIRKFFQ